MNATTDKDKKTMSEDRVLLPIALDDISIASNPRQTIEREPFLELKESIKKNGLLQPIVVRPAKGPGGQPYELIAGQRRLTAFRELAADGGAATFRTVPAIVVAVDDRAVPVLQLAENLNRQDLSPLEITNALAKAIAEGETVEALAPKLGWKKRQLYRYLQLNDAPAWLKEMAEEVKVPKKRVDESGKAQCDPVTGAQLFDVERLPGLEMESLLELITLHNTLKETDAARLAADGGASFRAHAEKMTRKLATSCAVNGWTRAKLREEARRAKNPTKPDARRPAPLPLFVVTSERVVFNLRPSEPITSEQREQIAEQLKESLVVYGFKKVIIQP